MKHLTYANSSGFEKKKKKKKHAEKDFNKYYC